MVFVLNGFNVQSVWYSRYLSSIASRGYLTIVTDLLHEEPLPYLARALPLACISECSPLEVASSRGTRVSCKVMKRLGAKTVAGQESCWMSSQHLDLA